jgi:hypothetical protein
LDYSRLSDKDVIVSQETNAAWGEFDRAMGDPRNLVAIHRGLNPNRGRRWAEPTINRGIIILTIAAWQAFVEDLAIGILETMRRSVGREQNLIGHFQLIEASTKSGVRGLNSPNSFNVLRVFANIGFDPEPRWGCSFGRTQFTPAEVTVRIDEWLKVRHAIAHGDDLPALSILARTKQGAPTLQRKNAESCMSLFTEVARRSTIAAGSQFP